MAKLHDTVTGANIKQLLTYIGVGAASNVFGFCLYLLLSYIGFSPKIAMSLLYAVGVFISYFGNGVLTFKGGLSGKTLLRFLMAQFLGYCLSLTVHFVVDDYFHLPHELAQLITIGSVALLLFFLFKFYVFKSPQGAKGRLSS